MATPPQFDLSSLFSPEPMDLGDVVSPQTPAAAPEKPKDQKREWLKLAMLLPLVMKGGPGALQGFVSGLNQSNVYNQHQSRLDAQEAARLQAQQDVISQRDRALEVQEANLLESRKQDLLKTFLGELGKTTSDGEVQALVGLYGPQAQGLGIPAGRLAGFAAQTQTPARTRVRLITQAWDRLSEGAKKTALEQPQFVIPLGDGTVADVSEVAKAVGLPIDPTTGKPPIAIPKPNVPNTPEEQFYQNYATERGKTSFRELPTTDQAAARKQWMQADDRPPVTVNAGTGNPRMDARIDRIVASFNSHPIVKEYNETQAQQGIVKSIVNGPWSGPGDMAAVFAFMKALDPTSVVREAEYANAAASGNIFRGWAARFNGALSESGGFLSERVRQDFLKTINARMKVKEGQYKNLRTQLAQRIDRIKAGAPETGDEALIDYATGAAPEAGPPLGPAIDLGGGITVRPVER